MVEGHTARLERTGNHLRIRVDMAFQQIALYSSGLNMLKNTVFMTSFHKMHTTLVWVHVFQGQPTGDALIIQIRPQ